MATVQSDWLLVFLSNRHHIPVDADEGDVADEGDGADEDDVADEGDEAAPADSLSNTFCDACPVGGKLI